MKALPILASLCFALGSRAVSQTFTNLDFELGSRPAGWNGFRSHTPEEIAVLLPGWSIHYYVDGVQSSLNGFPYLDRGDNACLGSACLFVMPRAASHGKFGLSLDSGGPLGCPQFSEWATAISQTALVPAQAAQMTFQAQFGRPRITVDGARVSLLQLAETNSWGTYSVDMRRFAGHVVTLAFATTYHPFDCTSPGGGAYTYLDNIRFDSTPPPRTISIKRGGGSSPPYLYLEFIGTLQCSDHPDSGYEDVLDARSPYVLYDFESLGRTRFYRARD